MDTDPGNLPPASFLSAFPRHARFLRPTGLKCNLPLKSLPFLFAREARREGRRIVARSPSRARRDPELASLVDERWRGCGSAELGKTIAAFTDRGVCECVMLGQIAPKNLFDLRPISGAMGRLPSEGKERAHALRRHCR
jgi:hypothetical protein